MSDRIIITEDQMDAIAERAARRVITMEYGDPPGTVAEHAARKAMSSVYEGVGRSVVKKFFYLVGACVLGLAAWMQVKGYL